VLPAIYWKKKFGKGLQELLDHGELRRLIEGSEILTYSPSLKGDNDQANCFKILVIFKTGDSCRRGGTDEKGQKRFQGGQRAAEVFFGLNA